MNINIGDYVQMGTYYGKPILWRCVDIDENGPLMLSDKIICLKAYDARGEANTLTGSHSREGSRQFLGSNYWADSNIRSWLNSSASAGEVEWLCGNPPDENHLLFRKYNKYDNEAGFLTSFTQNELKAVKEVTQKSLLANSDKSLDVTGSSVCHVFEENIEDVVQNYDSAYAENVMDKMFLPDVKQVNTVYNNSTVLGDDYYIGKPTDECVEHSKHMFSSFETGNRWSYLLRSPNAFDDTVRFVLFNGFVRNIPAHVSIIGLRPAFYLNPESAIFKSGSGTETSPYIF